MFDLVELSSNVFEARKPKTMCLGNFDGVHRGHRVLLEKLLETSKAINSTSSIIFFDPHPKQFFTNKRFHLIQSEKQKVHALKKLGVQSIGKLYFDEALSQLDYKVFFKVLIDKFNLKHLILGESASFGKNKEGSCDKVSEYLKHNDIACDVVDFSKYSECMFENDIISSSRIRKSLLQGDILTTNAMLGYAYEYENSIVKGNSLGRSIGFPTINLKMDQSLLLPKKGVYKTVSKLGCKEFKSVSNIGFRPTFNESKEIQLESHLIDYKGSDIYGETCTTRFVEKIRDEKKFSNPQELKKQIQNDIKTWY